MNPERYRRTSDLFDQALDLPEEAIAIGTVGRMSFQKDPETLYRAIAPLLRRRPSLHFLHLGEGELHDSLAKLTAALAIERQVRLCGYAENPLDFYHALDGLALTSRYEAGWPIVILEALACDLPIVSSRATPAAALPRRNARRSSPVESSAMGPPGRVSNHGTRRARAELRGARLRSESSMQELRPDRAARLVRGKLARASER